MMGWELKVKVIEEEKWKWRNFDEEKYPKSKLLQLIISVFRLFSRSGSRQCFHIGYNILSFALVCAQTIIMQLFHQYEDDHIFHKLKNTYFPGLYSLVGWKNIMYTEMEKLDSSQKKPGSLQGYRARCVLSAFMWRCYYWNAHYVPAGHRWYLLTANFDSEVKCCKFWTQSQHRSLPLTAIPRWSADIKGRRLWQRLRYILVCWDYMSGRRTKETIDTQRRWLVQDWKYNHKVHPEKFHHYGCG